MKRYFLFIPHLIILFIILVILANRLGITNTKGIIDETSSCYEKGACINTDWERTEEWIVVKKALVNDYATIAKVSEITKVSPKMIMAITSVEQMRLFFDEREIFKLVFKPLGKLGVQTNFSWGITGIKENTARQIEKNLKDKDSIFYLGKDLENILDFNTNNIDSERFDRLTDNKSNYYSYLYTALFIKQIYTQWEKSGYDIKNRPEILGTIYSLGFEKSIPKPKPYSGGSVININETKYSFGGLTYQIYNSKSINEIK